VRLLATGGGQTLARGTRTVKNGTRRAIDGRLTRAGRQFVQGGGVATVRVRLRVAYTNRHGRRRAERAGFALLLPLE
jgi:hypothetical protein